MELVSLIIIILIIIIICGDTYKNWDPEFQREKKKKRSRLDIWVFMLSCFRSNKRGPSKRLSLLPRPNVCQLFRSCHLPGSHAVCGGGRQPTTEASVPSGFHLSALTGPQPDIPSVPVLHSDLQTASIRNSIHLHLVQRFKSELQIWSLYSAVGLLSVSFLRGSNI